MVYSDFGFPDVQQSLGLTLHESELFRGVSALELAATFVERMRSDIAMALAINTEKARSEFIIAPMLAELRRCLGGRFGLFSGVQFDVDSSRGLHGFCDFILTRSPMQSVLTASIVAITEAKNDNIRTWLGQCIAAMVAAQEFNNKSLTEIGPIFGLVTTGAAWKFLKLFEKEVTLDVTEYFIAEMGQIMGILTHIVS